MAAHVIHFGEDSCHRLQVLNSAGYSVQNCVTLVQLGSTLSTHDDIEAVFFTEMHALSAERAVSLVRSSSSSPLILFRESEANLEEKKFDLVIQALTPPNVWLQYTHDLIEQSKMLRSESSSLIEESRVLRGVSAEVRRKSREEQERSRRQRSNDSFIDPWQH